MDLISPLIVSRVWSYPSRDPREALKRDPKRFSLALTGLIRLVLEIIRPVGKQKHAHVHPVNRHNQIRKNRIRDKIAPSKRKGMCGWEACRRWESSLDIDLAGPFADQPDYAAA